MNDGQPGRKLNMGDEPPMIGGRLTAEAEPCLHKAARLVTMSFTLERSAVPAGAPLNRITSIAIQMEPFTIQYSVFSIPYWRQQWKAPVEAAREKTSRVSNREY